jgi:outer membrane protein W
MPAANANGDAIAVTGEVGATGSLPATLAANWYGPLKKFTDEFCGREV